MIGLHAMQLTLRLTPSGTAGRAMHWLGGLGMLLGALTSTLLPNPAQAADCTRTATTCVEGPATRTFDGVALYKDCWRYRSDYSCLSSQTSADCQALSDKGCSQVGSTCLETHPDGACTLLEQTWQCSAGRTQGSVVTQCGDQRFCLEGRCFDSGYPPDADFARAVASLEIQREAGRYLDPTTLQVFKGFDNRCRKKLFGLVNCCKGGGADASAFTNLNLMSAAGGQAAGALGSSYVYDALFASDAPNLVLSGFEALFGTGGSSALAGMVAGDITVTSFMEALVPGPWSLAILAIQLSGLLSCEPDEQVLSMKRGNRLCHELGSYCSKRIPIIRTCVETTQRYCCFNSRLSRILNEQGRAQLGKAWGSARAPDCSGFTLTQLQTLDFGAMDLSEFLAEIAPTAPDLEALKARTGQAVQGMVKP